MAIDTNQKTEKHTTPDAPFRTGVNGKYKLLIKNVSPKLLGYEYELVDAEGKEYKAEHQKHYAEGEHCVPLHPIVTVDERNREDILVWGDFWVFNYNQVGDTLKCVSGGNYPGRMHIRQTENGFEVTGFDPVEDGSGFIPSAKRIFGNKFEVFNTIHDDAEARERLRAEGLAVYAKKHNLSVTMYQDYGWPSKRLPPVNL